MKKVLYEDICTFCCGRLLYFDIHVVCADLILLGIQIMKSKKALMRDISSHLYMYVTN
jgi:hypothetical protein